MLAFFMLLGVVENNSGVPLIVCFLCSSGKHGCSWLCEGKRPDGCLCPVEPASSLNGERFLQVACQCNGYEKQMCTMILQDRCRAQEADTATRHRSLCASWLEGPLSGHGDEGDVPCSDCLPFCKSDLYTRMYSCTYLRTMHVTCVDHVIGCLCVRI